MARRRKIKSRLARKEEKRLKRQTTLLVLVTVFLLFAIIYWGIPALIRMAIFLGELRSSSQPVEQENNIPPAPPQMLSLAEATQNNSLDIEGFAQPEMTVVLYRDGSKVEEVIVDDESQFKFAGVRLLEGENRFWVVTINKSGKESQPSDSQTVVFDTQAPSLSVDQPKDGAEFSGNKDKAIQVEGMAEAGVQVFVNDQFVSVGNEGEFNTRVSLSEGENQIRVRAVDEAGNETSTELKVRYSP